MPKIVLEHVTKRWGNYYGVDDLNLVIEDNSFITLLGPSGCGKTTTLRMIAGLETPTSGKITIGDKVVFDSELGINVPASKRKVGFLFQNYALWPNMTVYQNISFGLKNVKEEMDCYDEEIKILRRINEILANPNELKEIVSEVYEKKTKTEVDRTILKLIDTYEVSEFTAKKLKNYGFNEAEDPKTLALEIIENNKKKIEEMIAKYKAKQIEIDDESRLISEGQIVRKVRRLTSEEIDLAVRRSSRKVKIGEFMNRYPSELSGGQQQRVAIARTLAPQPSVLFMDEPLSNLDAKLRLEMRSELQRLHITTGSTFVYVTHDQLEAMTLATKICLINNGVLQQYEKPLDIYRKPNNLFVADFVGNPSINLIEVKGKQNESGNIDLSFFDGLAKATFVPNQPVDVSSFHQLQLKIDEENINQEKAKVDNGYVPKSNKDLPFKYHIPKIDETEVEEKVNITDEDYILAIRPEFIDFNGKDFEGVIYSAMPAGMETTVKIRVGNYLLTGVIFGDISFAIDEKISFSIKGKGILLYDRRTTRIFTLGKIVK